MHIKNGKDRLVVLFPKFGIVLKFSYIRIFQALKFLREDFKHRKERRLAYRWEWPMEIGGSYRRLFFGGISANINEFEFYLSDPNEFLQPTYFSLGFVNMQKHGTPIDFTSEKLWKTIIDVLGKDAFKASHHFASNDNYCMSGGNIKMCDYGSSKVIDLLKEHHKAIFAALNKEPH